MLSLARPITITAALLLIMPVVLWLSGWQWQPDIADNSVIVWYWITQSVSRPWGIITHLLLSGWFLWCLRFRWSTAIIVFIIFTGVILLGQYINSTVKNVIQEPRPFVVWLEKQQRISADQFYQLKRKVRTKWLREQQENMVVVPTFLGQHWQKETGFAFPSGHTTFAVSWTLLGAGLLWPQRRWLSLAVLMLWATGVMGSRLALGMHWPQDLVAATFVSWLLTIPAVWLIRQIAGPPPKQAIPGIEEQDNRQH